MKKLFTFFAPLLALLLLLPLAVSCSVTVVDSSDEDTRPYIVCTIFPQYDFIRNIAGERVRLEMLTPPGSDAHNFIVDSPAKLEELTKADLIVCVGGETDGKLVSDLKTALPSSVRYLSMLDMVSEKLMESETPGMHIEKQSGGQAHAHDDSDEIDEHVWTSPKRALEIVAALTNALCALDPDGEELYRMNAAEYAEKLSDLDDLFSDISAKKSIGVLIFADRFPFRYLCYDYGISADAAFLGCSADCDPTTSTLEYLTDEAKQLRVPAILYMEGSDPQYAEGIAGRTGGKALMLHSCHVPSPAEFESESYLSLMTRNAGVLKTALGVKD